MSEKTYTYESVRETIQAVVNDKPDFIYYPSSECDTCFAHNDWDENGDEMFDEEPPRCAEHYEGEACRYFYGDPSNPEVSNVEAPACVIGNWFAREEIQPTDLGEENWNGVEGHAIGTLLKSSELKIDEKGAAFLASMQLLQDEGKTWERAFELSVERAESATDQEPVKE